MQRTRDATSTRAGSGAKSCSPGLLGASLALFLAYPVLRTELRPAGAPARPPDDDGPRRPPRRRARGRPLLGRGPPASTCSSRAASSSPRSPRRVFAIGPQLRRHGVQPPERLVGAASAACSAWRSSPPRRSCAAAASTATGRSPTRSPPPASRSSSRGRCCARSGRRCPDHGSRRQRLAAVLSHGHARAAGIHRARRSRRLGRALPQPRRRPRAMARARLHAHALRRAAPRLPAAAREHLRLAGRLPAHARVRR